MASDATMRMGLEAIRNALQGPGRIRCGCAFSQAPWKPAATGRPWPHPGRPAKGGRTSGQRTSAGGDAVVFAKGKRRTLKARDAGNAFKALRSHGAGDDAFLEMGDSTDEALCDGEVSGGIFALSVEGELAESVGGSGS